MSAVQLIAPGQGVLSQFCWDPRRAKDAAPDTVWLDAVTRVGEIDRRAQPPERAPDPGRTPSSATSLARYPQAGETEEQAPGRRSWSRLAGRPLSGSAPQMALPPLFPEPHTVLVDGDVMENSTKRSATVPVDRIGHWSKNRRSRSQPMPISLETAVDRYVRARGLSGGARNDDLIGPASNTLPLRCFDLRRAVRRWSYSRRFSGAAIPKGVPPSPLPSVNVGYSGVAVDRILERPPENTQATGSPTARSRPASKTVDISESRKGKVGRDLPD